MKPTINISTLLIKHRAYLIREGILLSYTLFVTHFFIYQKLPFQKGYEFPLFTYIIISLMASFICTVNHYAYVKTKLPSSITSYWGKLGYQVLFNAVVSMLSYTFIYLLVNIVIFGSDFSVFRFLKYLAISETIIISYILTLTAYKLYKNTDSFQFKNEAEDKTLIVPSGQKDLQLKVADIAFIYSKGGMVSVHLKNHDRLITQYSSIDEIQDQFPIEQFYRVSRQYLINKEAVKEVQRDKNRKLILHPDPELFNGHTEEIVVSRYRSKEFKKWLKGELQELQEVPLV
ncbi:MAG: response regulator transcription factor [Cyclobacteriaceae bacterium]|nr:response regulator transcription factor [Cyclobacteriaceae bacterium]